jgi:hypothetical protein
MHFVKQDEIKTVSGRKIPLGCQWIYRSQDIESANQTRITDAGREVLVAVRMKRTVIWADTMLFQKNVHLLQG